MSHALIFYRIPIRSDIPEDAMDFLKAFFEGFPQEKTKIDLFPEMEIAFMSAWKWSNLIRANRDPRYLHLDKHHRDDESWPGLTIFQGETSSTAFDFDQFKTLLTSILPAMDQKGGVVLARVIEEKEEEEDTLREDVLWLDTGIIQHEQGYYYKGGEVDNEHPLHYRPGRKLILPWDIEEMRFQSGLKHQRLQQRASGRLYKLTYRFGQPDSQERIAQNLVGMMEVDPEYGIGIDLENGNIRPDLGLRMEERNYGFLEDMNVDVLYALSQDTALLFTDDGFYIARTYDQSLATKLVQKAETFFQIAE